MRTMLKLESDAVTGAVALCVPMSIAPRRMVCVGSRVRAARDEEPRTRCDSCVPARTGVTMTTQHDALRPPKEAVEM